jgi:antitoxin VapB
MPGPVSCGGSKCNRFGLEQRLAQTSFEILASEAPGNRFLKGGVTSAEGVKGLGQNLGASGITPFLYDYTMALNIKDPETEQLAADVASLAGESKTAAIRQALRERRQRLLLARDGRGRGDRMVDVLEVSLWPQLPAGVRGTPVARAQREAILGYGPEGV